jgi:glycosyltransferase involved in cell wall biosynthesis
MTQPLTVLHVHSGNLYGGIESGLVTLLRHPGTLHHRVALSYESQLAGRLRGAGAEVHILGEARFGRPWSVWLARRRLLGLVAAQPPAVMMCHSPWSLAAFGPVAHASGVPLGLWAHGAFTGRHWLERLARFTAPPDFALCNSEFTRSALPSAFPGTPSQVIRQPVEIPPTFDPARRPVKRGGHGAGPDTVVITMVARLEPWKGHAALLDALASLRDVPGWTAWIVGGAQRRAEDMYRASLERRVNETRIADRVHFLGQRDDVASLLWASDVYCQPNAEPEPFGITFVEALYAGLPVVATDWGGPRETVTPDCGIMVPPGNPDALRDVLSRLIADGELRRRLGAAGPARAAALCDPERIAARLAQILQTLSSPRRAAP